MTDPMKEELLDIVFAGACALLGYTLAEIDEVLAGTQDERKL